MFTLLFTLVLFNSLAEEAAVIEKITIVPDKYSLTIYDHQFPADNPFPCWTYVSDGLSDLGQQELVFSVTREANEKLEDYPKDLVMFYRMVYNFAKKGSLVKSGDTSSLSTGILGRADFKNIFYTPAFKFENLSIEKPFLTAIILDDQEKKMADAYGFLRAMALIGEVNSFFPTSPWIDRKRLSIVSEEMMKDSVLNQTVNLHAHDYRFSLVGADGNKGNRILVTILEGEQDLSKLFEYHTEGITIMGWHDPLADAILTWTTGQKQVTGIGPNGSQSKRPNGNFLMILTGRERTYVNHLEDGFVLWVTDEDWPKVRDALLQKKPFYLPVEKGIGIEVEVLPTHLDVAGNSAFAPEGWQTYKPQTEVKQERTTEIPLENVTLLSPQSRLEGKVDVFAQFSLPIIKSTDLCAPMGTEGPAYDMVINATLKPDRTVDFEILTNLDETQETPEELNCIGELLKAIKGIDLGDEPFRVQYAFKARGGHPTTQPGSNQEK